MDEPADPGRTPVPSVPLRRVARDPLVIAAVVVWLGALLILHGLDRAHTLAVLTIVASDQVALPDTEVELVAQVERRLPSGRIERSGIEVDLRLTSEPEGAGRTVTDAAGIARRSVIVPTEPKAHRYVVEVPGTPVAAPPLHTDPQVRVVPPGRPVVLVDLDGTLVDRGSLGPIPPEAVAALQRLGLDHALVFLHAGDPGRLDDLRGILPRRGLPPAPIVGLRRPDESAAAYRRRQLATWRENLDASIIAVAGTEAGCLAMREARFDTITLGTAPCEGARAAETWGDLPARVSGD